MPETGCAARLDGAMQGDLLFTAHPSPRTRNRISVVPANAGTHHDLRSRNLMLDRGLRRDDEHHDTSLDA